jgi:hypothetical protein
MMKAKFSVLLSVTLLISQASTTVWSQTGVPKSKKSLTLREVKVKEGVQYELCAERHSLGELLEAVAAAAGLQVVVDPVIKRRPIPKIWLAARNLDDMLEMLATHGKATGMRKVGSVRYITAKKKGQITRISALLTVPPPEPSSVDPHFVFPKEPFTKTEPKPDRPRFSFNEREVYLIPVKRKTLKQDQRYESSRLSAEILKRRNTKGNQR